LTVNTDEEMNYAVVVSEITLFHGCFGLVLQVAVVVVTFPT